PATPLADRPVRLAAQKGIRSSQKATIPAAIESPRLFVLHAARAATNAPTKRISPSPRSPPSDGVTSAAKTAIGTKCRKRSQNGGGSVRRARPAERDPKDTATNPASAIPNTKRPPPARPPAPSPPPAPPRSPAP